jgi:hypothetical protein
MQRGICKEVKVVWMQAKKVEKAEGDLANGKLCFRSRTTTTTTQFHRRRLPAKTLSSQTGSCYVLLYAVLRDNGYLSLQFRLIMPVPSRPMTSDGAVT